MSNNIANQIEQSMYKMPFNSCKDINMKQYSSCCKRALGRRNINQ